MKKLMIIIIITYLMMNIIVKIADDNEYIKMNAFKIIKKY